MRIQRISWIHRDLSVISTHICTTYAIYRDSSTQMLYLYSLSSSSNPRNRDIAIVSQPHHHECHKCRIARAPAGKFAPRNRLYRTDVPCHFAFNPFSPQITSHGCTIGSEVASSLTDSRMLRTYISRAGLEIASRARLSNAINGAKKKTVRTITYKKYLSSKRFVILELRNCVSWEEDR